MSLGYRMTARCSQDAEGEARAEAQRETGEGWLSAMGFPSSLQSNGHLKCSMSKAPIFLIAKNVTILSLEERISSTNSSSSCLAFRSMGELIC